MSYRYSLAYLTVHEVSPVEAVKIAAQTGYDALGIRLLPSSPTDGPFPLLGDAKMQREMRAALTDTGVALADIEIIRIDQGFDPSAYDEFLDLGKRLGAQHVLVAGDDSEQGRLTDSYGRFCERAAQFELTADLEFMPWTAVPNVSVSAEIVAAVGQANAGLLVDALHYARSDSHLEQLAQLPAEWLNYVQLCDAPSEYDSNVAGLIHTARDERLLPGRGGINLAEMLSVLPKDLVLSIEIPRRAEAAKVSAAERAAQALGASKALVESLS